MGNTDLEIRAINGKHYLFYKGEKLPGQCETIVKQGFDELSTTSPYAIVTVTFTQVKLKDTE